MVWVGLVGAVSFLNYTHYGLFAKTEFDAATYKGAYAALLSVKPLRSKPPRTSDL